MQDLIHMFGRKGPGENVMRSLQAVWIKVRQEGEDAWRPVGGLDGCMSGVIGKMSYDPRNVPLPAVKHSPVCVRNRFTAVTRPRDSQRAVQLWL